METRPARRTRERAIDLVERLIRSFSPGSLNPWKRPWLFSPRSVLVQNSAGFGIEIIHAPVQHLRNLDRREPRHRIVRLLIEDESARSSLEIEVLEQRGSCNEPANVATSPVEVLYFFVENDRQEIHCRDLVAADVSG